MSPVLILVVCIFEGDNLLLFSPLSVLEPPAEDEVGSEKFKGPPSTAKG